MDETKLLHRTIYQKKTDSSNFSQFFFGIPQQLTIHKCLTEKLGKTYDLTKRPIKRFFDTHLFEQVMFEMCKEAYDCTRTEMIKYVDFVVRQQEMYKDTSERYLNSMKALDIDGMDTWLVTHRQQLELIIDVDTSDI